MKKTIVLLTIVLAFVAAPVFAETSAAFSGSVDYMFGTDFSDYDEDVDNASEIGITGIVGEFTTVTLSFKIKMDSDGDAVTDAAMDTTNLILTQDVTGALGIDGPLSFSYKLGKQDFAVADYSGVAGYAESGADAETDSQLGLAITIGATPMFNLDVVAYPKSYFDEVEEFAINAYGTIEIVDYSAYFLMTQADDDYGTEVMWFGANMGMTMDALSVGAMVEAYTNTALDGDIIARYGAAAKYQVTEAFSAGAAFGSKYEDGVDFVDASAVGLNVNYDFTEGLGVWGAVKIPFAEVSDNLGYEVGLWTALDGVTYELSWTDKSDYKAYDAELDGNLSIRVKASF